jgi:hypothetical protein
MSEKGGTNIGWDISDEQSKRSKERGEKVETPEMGCFAR